MGPPCTGMLLLISLIVLLRNIDVSGIKIVELESPRPVKNGTVDHVVLDCVYTYDEGDSPSLVVKWFLNNNQQPVYQWIPPQPPQASGILNRRVDLDYKVSNDTFTMHRALKLLRPTIELHGEYRCQVSSFEGEDDKKATFFVYSPATFVKIQYTKPNDDTVNVSCYGTGMFPKPHAGMFIFKGNKHNRTPVHGTVLQTSYSHGVYSATLHKVFQDRNLAAEIEFECYFSFPEAGYKVYDRITYYPAGSCPADTACPIASNPIRCSADLQCPSAQKCCQVTGSQSRCCQPAVSSSTTGSPGTTTTSGGTGSTTEGSSTSGSTTTTSGGSSTTGSSTSSTGSSETTSTTTSSGSTGSTGSTTATTTGTSTSTASPTT